MTTGQLFLHSWRHFLGLHLSEVTIAIRVNRSDISLPVILSLSQSHIQNRFFAKIKKEQNHKDINENTGDLAGNNCDYGITYNFDQSNTEKKIDLKLWSQKMVCRDAEELKELCHRCLYAFLIIALINGIKRCAHARPKANARPDSLILSDERIRNPKLRSLGFLSESQAQLAYLLFSLNGLELKSELNG